MNGDSPSTANRGKPALDNRCPLCAAAELIGRHCKLLCPNCGYVESCEDIFPTDRYCRRAAQPSGDQMHRPLP
ncbi:MAG: hypothetical protein H6816_04475 [Phycisphaerales bacterium]|nr:hypothetical protein [Phycisphaerales bacterium]